MGHYAYIGKRKYKFMGREGNVLIWQATDAEPNSNHVEEIRCSRDYFWSSNG